MAADLLGSLAAAISRSSLVKRLETCSPMGTNISYGLVVEIVELDGADGAVLLFVDEDDVHEAHNAALRQVQQLGNDLAGRLGVLEGDQGIFQGKVEHWLTPLLDVRRAPQEPCGHRMDLADSRTRRYCRAIATFMSASVSGISSPDRSIVTRLMVPVKRNSPLYSSGAAGSPAS